MNMLVSSSSCVRRMVCEAPLRRYKRHVDRSKVNSICIVRLAIRISLCGVAQSVTVYAECSLWIRLKMWRVMHLLSTECAWSFVVACRRQPAV